MLNAITLENLSLSERAVIAAKRSLSGRYRFAGILALAGPSIVTAVAYVDPGNLATNIQAGSKFGYKLLWVVVLANLTAMLFQAMSAKLGIVTGRNLAELCRSVFPRPLVYFMWTVSELAAMATDLAELLGASVGLQLLLGMPLLPSMALAALLSYGLLLLQGRGFRPLELAIAILVGVVAISFFLQLGIAPPHWGMVLHDSLVPSLPNKGALTLAVAIFGATVMPHAIMLHSSLTQARIPVVNDRERGRLISYSNMEVLITLAIAGLVNMAMIMVATVAFHDTGHTDLDQIETAYQMLTPLFNGSAALLFMLAVLASGLSSTVVGTMAGQVVMQGFVGFQIPLWVRRVVTMLPAFIVILLGLNITQALVISQVILSLTLPVPLIALTLLMRKTDIMGSFVNSKRVSWIAGFLIICILLLNSFMILQSLGIDILA